MNEDIFNLKGFKSVHEPTLSNEILDCLVEFFDWGLLQKGNYFNVTLAELDRQGQDLSLLTMSESKGIPKGRAWEGKNPNWVWQSGIGYTPPPIVADGIYFNDVFLPLNNQTNPYYIDYYNGRVVFESTQPVNSKVQVEHAYKWINVEYANSFDGMKSVQTEGDKLPPELTINLPTIAIEVVNRSRMTGYELGGGQLVETMVLFHCIARDEPTRNRMIDIVSYQNDKSIFTFDSVKIAENEDFPIDYRGFPKNGALNFRDLVIKYPRYKLRFSNLKTSEIKMVANTLFGSTVKMDVEMVKHDI